MLAEDLDLALELDAQRVEHRLHPAPDLALEQIAGAREVLARVVALEPLEPRERLLAEPIEHAIELRT